MRLILVLGLLSVASATTVFRQYREMANRVRRDGHMGVDHDHGEESEMGSLDVNLLEGLEEAFGDEFADGPPAACARCETVANDCMGTEDAPGPCMEDIQALFVRALSGDVTQEEMTPNCMSRDLQCIINFAEELLPSFASIINCLLGCVPADLLNYNTQTIQVPLGGGNALFTDDVCNGMTSDDVAGAIVDSLTALGDDTDLETVRADIAQSASVSHISGGGCRVSFSNVYSSDDEKLEPSDVAQVMSTDSFKAFVVDEVQAGNSDASSFSTDDVQTVSSSDVAESSVSVQASTGSASSSATLGLMMAAVALVAMRQ